MSRFVLAASCGALLALSVSAPAAAASPSAVSCTGFPKYGAFRTVSGNVLAVQTDGLGVTHIVMHDDNTGCRVYALASGVEGCADGRHYEAIGRLRSAFKGEDYDATLSLGRDKGVCS